MVQEITGDLLDVDANVICHQVNFLGTMGAGVAAAIRQKLLTPAQYAEYENFCWSHHSMALGYTQFVEVAPGEKWVANMFSQSDHYLDVLERLTDYSALYACLHAIREFAEKHNASVAFPANVGCGIAGGDWNTVKNMLVSVFQDSSINAYIVSRPKAVCMLSAYGPQGV
jgi:O-acetyl-ADP-ribose deacetylase (regulator of RNase III)